MRLPPNEKQSSGSKRSRRDVTGKKWHHFLRRKCIKQGGKISTTNDEVPSVVGKFKGQ